MNRWLEPLLALVVVGGMIRTLIYLWNNGYLPQPYFYDPEDWWMDWFNTASWAWDGGAYDSWGTVYAPLTFVFLKFTTLSKCYPGGSNYYSAYDGRECDWLSVGLLHIYYVIDIIIIAVIFYKSDRSTALPRSIALAISLPLTNMVERGNILIFAFACMMLAYGPIFKSARVRWLFIGLAINFKLYLLASLLPHLFKRRWRWVEGALISVALVYALAFCIYGQGTPLQIYTNVVNYTESSATALLDVWYTATYVPLVSLLNNPSVPIVRMLGSPMVEFLLFVLPLSQRLVQLAILAAFVFAWLRPEVVSLNRLIMLGLSFAIVTVESGGYSQAFIIYFVFLERWGGFARNWAIVACYILCLQFDIIIDSAAPIVRYTFFNHSTTIVQYYIMAGPFFRPGLLYSIPFALSCATIAVVWKDIRAQGWKSRWRYRHDLPIMVGAGAALPPGAPQPA